MSCYEKIKNLKVRNLCVKDVKTLDIDVKNINGVTGTFQNLNANNANIDNLNVDFINGVNLNCQNTFNASGIITPVVYKNGQPQQPINDGTFNQNVLNDLWTFNLLANAFTNLDSASGRLRNTILSNFYNCPICPAYDISNCDCPIPGYATFTGFIVGNILNVTAILPNNLTPCPPTLGIIQIGQQIYGQQFSFLSSTIISQLSGEIPGGIGAYEIQNEFNNYSKNVAPQTMLSLSKSTINECINVPLKIYGVETLSVSDISSRCSSIMSAISYNLNVVNQSLNTRLAAIYVQVGYQIPGSTEPVNIQGLEIDTRQFDPSILSFGEQMNNTVLLPTNLIQQIATYNFSDKINAVIQLVVYVEDGVEVLIPSTSTSSRNIASRNVNSLATSVSTNYSVSFTNSSLKITTPGTYKIPADAKFVTLKAGGGGGGSVDPVDQRGGGGGGSGDEIKNSIPSNAVTFTVEEIGNGGASNTDGGNTSGFFLDNSGNKIGNNIVVVGGKKGEIFYGGAGYAGGGGGSPFGQGGIGTMVGCNGHDSVNDSSGDGGCNPGSGSPYFGSGGGGGGKGGGSAIIPGEEFLQLNNAKESSGGGGAGNSQFGGSNTQPAGKGGNGFVIFTPA